MSDNIHQAFKIVSCYSPEEYPCSLPVKFAENATPEQSILTYKGLLAKTELEDYFIFKKGKTIKLYFKTEDEKLIAAAALAPNTSFKIDFYDCGERTGLKKMKKIANDFKTAFNLTAVGQKVEFIVDQDRHYICAKLPGGPDFVEFLKVSRPLRELYDHDFEPEYSLDNLT